MWLTIDSTFLSGVRAVIDMLKFKIMCADKEMKEAELFLKAFKKEKNSAEKKRLAA